MKKPSEETMRKFVDFCDSGRPWYFGLGVFITILIVQTALWFQMDEDKKPGWWYTVPTWFGIFRCIGCIFQARKNRERDAE